MAVATIEYRSPTFFIADAWVPEDLQAKIKRFDPHSGMGRILSESLRYLPAEQAAELVDSICSTCVVETSLGLVHISERGAEDLGIVGRKVITTAGVNWIVGILTGSNTANILKFHALGTGTNAESTGDTALQTELTTQYNPDNTRATGTTATGGSSNVYQSVATNTVDASCAITEHGILTQAATGGGTLLDRFKFSVVNLNNGDSLQSTFNCTFTAGG